MDWKKLSPWNWFKKEQQQQAHSGLEDNVGYPAQSRHGDAPSADPFRQMRLLLDDMTRQFGMHPVQSGFPGAGLSNAWFRPSVDIRESETQYTINVELPGVERDDVEVEVEQDSVVIRGEKHQEKETDEDNYHVIESRHGTFQRVLDLPADSNTDDLTATFKNGLLTIKIGRNGQTHAGGRRIAVN